MRGVQPIRGGVMHGYNDPQNQGGGMSAAGGIEEVVNVPGNLSDFASDPKFQQILLKVKLQTSINFVDLQRDKGTNKVLAIVINAPTSETAGNARRLVETHFKNQIKIMSAEAKLAKTQTELFSAQGEVASGMMVDFFVPISVIGLVIGKSGARIKQIEKDTGVSSINVDGHTGKIMVVGPDAASVQSARELLELQEDVLPLNSSQAEWLSNDRFNGSLTDIRADNNLSSARVDRDNTQLSVVGTVPAIRSLRAMLPVQLEYIDKAIEIESTERHAREQLRDFKREHGMRGMGDDRRGYQGRGGVRAGSNSNSSGYGAAGRPNQNPNPKPPAPPSTSTGASTGKGTAKGKKGGEAAVTMTVTGLPPTAPEETKAKAKQTKTPAPAAAPKKEEPAAKKGKAKKGDSKKGDEVDQLTAKVAAVKVEDAPPAAKAKKGAAAKKGKDEEKISKDKKDDGKVQAANDKIPAPEGGAGPEDSKRRRGNNKKDKKEGTAVTPTPAAAATATTTATTAEKDKKDKEGVESKEGKGKKSKAKAKKEDAPKEVAAPAAGPAEGAKEEGKPKPKPKKAANKKTDKQEKSTDPTPESTTKAPATGGEAKEKKDSKGKADKKEKDSTAKQAEKTDGGVLDIAPLGKREKKDRGANKADKAEKASAEKASNPEVSAEA